MPEATKLRLQKTLTNHMSPPPHLTTHLYSSSMLEYRKLYFKMYS